LIIHTHTHAHTHTHTYTHTYTHTHTQVQQQTQPDPAIAAMKKEMEELRTVFIKKEKKRYTPSQYTPHN
jgi:hypothetical protein